MTTAILDKIDLKTFIGDLEKEEDPKTLMEIYKEVGAFPFAVRAVSNGREIAGSVAGIKKGRDMLVTGVCRTYAGHFITDQWRVNHSPDSYNANVPRWQLLGHK